MSAWNPPTGPRSAPTGQKNNIFRAPIKTVSLDLWATDKLLWGRIQAPLLHSTGLWPESVSTMMWHFSFKAACQRYNTLDMNKYGKTLEQKHSGVRF